jgi:hypothetical protein
MDGGRREGGREGRGREGGRVGGKGERDREGEGERERRREREAADRRKSLSSALDLALTRSLTLCAILCEIWQRARAFSLSLPLPFAFSLLIPSFRSDTLPPLSSSLSLSRGQTPPFIIYIGALLYIDIRVNVYPPPPPSPGTDPLLPHVPDLPAAAGIALPGVQQVTSVITDIGYH